MTGEPGGNDGPALDVLMPVGRADVDGLFSLSLRLALKHLRPIGVVHVVTPDADAARRKLRGLVDSEQIKIWSDQQVFPEAQHLPGWFRQQYIKLHADRVVDRDQILVLGADTLVLERTTTRQILRGAGQLPISGSEQLPVLRWFRYDWPGRHLQFERARVLNVASLLGVEPTRALLLGDFVCDLFAFDREVLRSLRSRLDRSGGLLSVLAALGTRQNADPRFGEWTAYAVFCLDVARCDVPVRRGESGFFGQVHSQHDLQRASLWRHRILHFAWKPSDWTPLLAKWTASGPGCDVR